VLAALSRRRSRVQIPSGPLGPDPRPRSRGQVAQSVERAAENRKVGGSIPSLPTTSALVRRPAPRATSATGKGSSSAFRHQSKPFGQLAHPLFLHATKPQPSLQHPVENSGNGKVPEPDPAGQSALYRPRATGPPARPRISRMNNPGAIRSWLLGEGAGKARMQADIDETAIPSKTRRASLARLVKSSTSVCVKADTTSGQEPAGNGSRVASAWTSPATAVPARRLATRSWSAEASTPTTDQPTSAARRGGRRSRSRRPDTSPIPGPPAVRSAAPQPRSTRQHARRTSPPRRRSARMPSSLPSSPMTVASRTHPVAIGAARRVRGLPTSAAATGEI